MKIEKNKMADYLVEEFDKHFQEFTSLEKVEIILHRCFGGIYDFFRYDMVAGLKNFWRYRSVIWRHRWYDYSFADEVVREMYKERAEKWHQSHYVGAEEDEKLLNKIVDLFESLRIENEYVVDYGEDGKFLNVSSTEDHTRKEIYSIIASKMFWD